MNPKKSQSIVDFAIALIAIAALAVGIVRIWIWFNANYARRQVGYQQSRLLAAGPNRPIKTSDYSQPTGIGANDTNRTQDFQPLELTENWVFKGEASGTIGGKKVAPISSAASGCAFRVELLTSNYRNQIISNCGPDEDCDSCTYSDCDTEAGCGIACSLRKTADDMRETAKECGGTLNVWKLCWWFGGKKAGEQLEESADDLDDEAEELEKTTNDVAALLDASDCCSEATTELQNDCISQLQEDIKELWEEKIGDDS